MGGVSVDSGKGGKKSLDTEINMVPMIDLLLCLICFLLITAVWSTMAKLDANAQVPGQPKPVEDDKPKEPDPMLHITIQEDKFQIAWRKGGALDGASVDVPRTAEFRNADKKEKPFYPKLAEEVQKQWAGKEGMHRQPTDEKLDQAVLHCDNNTPYEEVIAVVDAVYQTRRKFPAKVVGVSNTEKEFPAMNLTFSMN